MKTHPKTGDISHIPSVYLLQFEPHYWQPDPAR